MIYERIEILLDLQLDSNIRSIIDQNTCILHFPAGLTVLHEGDNSTSLYILLNGIARGYYIDNHGNDITKCFYQKGGMFAYEGLETELPSSFTIECLEDCECVEIPYKLMNKVLDMNNEIIFDICKYFKRELHKLESRSMDLVMKNAEERYCLFCDEYPDVHNRIALKYIASYIGVRISSLSRIRKHIKKSRLN